MELDDDDGSGKLSDFFKDKFPLSGTTPPSNIHAGENIRKFIIHQSLFCLAKIDQSLECETNSA